MATPLNAVVQGVASAPGTGAIPLGSAISGFQSFASAGAVNGATYSYRIDDGSNFELGTGTYTSGANPTLSRNLVYSSSGALLSASAAAVVSCVALAADLAPPAQAQLPSFRNRLINGNFVINQRNAATASTSYSAGAYVMDRWKAGANGATLSFAFNANGDVTVTLTAGTLLQIIEGGRYLQEGGTYTASWTGTATGRVYQGTATGSYVASPFTTTGLTAGTNTTVEFSTGTIGTVQFEPGSSATAFERRDDELYRCSRYAQLMSLSARYNGGGDPYPTTPFNFVPTMRATPSNINISAGTSNNGYTMQSETAMSPQGGPFQITGGSGSDIKNRINLYIAEL